MCKNTKDELKSTTCRNCQQKPCKKFGSRLQQVIAITPSCSSWLRWPPSLYLGWRRKLCLLLVLREEETLPPIKECLPGKGGSKYSIVPLTFDSAGGGGGGGGGGGEEEEGR